MLIVNVPKKFIAVQAIAEIVDQVPVEIEVVIEVEEVMIVGAEAAMEVIVVVIEEEEIVDQVMEIVDLVIAVAEIEEVMEEAPLEIMTNTIIETDSVVAHLFKEIKMTMPGKIRYFFPQEFKLKFQSNYFETDNKKK